MGVQSVQFDRVKVAAEMARIRCGVTELANKACVGRAVVWKAKNDLPVEKKCGERIAAALNVPLSDLLVKN